MPALARFAKSELIETLRGIESDTRCLCGKPKERRQSLCRRCNGALPKDKRMGLGSPEALTRIETLKECIWWLEDNMYIRTGSSKNLFGTVHAPIKLPPLLKRPSPKKVVSKLIVFPDGREKAVGREWDNRREEVSLRAESRCERMVARQYGPDEDRCIRLERCNRPAPLHAINGIPPGDAHHVKRRKVRDDRKENLLWCCHDCHRVIHKPEKVLPSKGRIL